MRTETEPKFKVGHRFTVPGYKHQSATDLNMIITYVYHNGTTWKYHCGLIVAKRFEDVPAPYTNVGSLRTLEDIQYVDYCTAEEGEL